LSDINMSRRPGGRNPDKVASIADTLDKGASMDPIVLVERQDQSQYRYDIADGWHRTLGAEKAGVEDVPAFIGEGFDDKTEWGLEMQDTSDSVKKAAVSELAVLRRFLRNGGDIAKFSAAAIDPDVMRLLTEEIATGETAPALERARRRIIKDYGMSGPLACRSCGARLFGAEAGDGRCMDCQISEDVQHRAPGTDPFADKDFSLTGPLSTGLVPYDLAGQKPLRPITRCRRCNLALDGEGSCPVHGADMLKFDPEEARSTDGKWAGGIDSGDAGSGAGSSSGSDTSSSGSDGSGKSPYKNGKRTAADRAVLDALGPKGKKGKGSKGRAKGRSKTGTRHAAAGKAPQRTFRESGPGWRHRHGKADEPSLLKAVEDELARRGVDLAKYSPDQPRDDAGRFAPSPGSGSVLGAAAGVVNGAMVVEPAITSALSNIAAATGGNIDTAFTMHDGTVRHTLEARLKTVSSTAAKIAGDAAVKHLSIGAAAAQVKDSVRYTVTYPAAKYADGAEAMMNQMKAAGFEPERGKNFWGHENGYAGINTVWHDPASGQSVEVQFHTPETLQYKEGTGHPLYEAQRGLLPSSAAWQGIQSQIDQGWSTIRAGVPYLDHISEYLAATFPKAG
jgi:hypothetical protein